MSLARWRVRSLIAVALLSVPPVAPSGEGGPLPGGGAISGGGPVHRDRPIRAFCLDFNWGPGGKNGFAGPGVWASASPEEHVEWYAGLGANVIQTFAVSCNGRAWYRGGPVPEQPGLKSDFLKDVVRLGHERGMLVMGYFCVGANTLWGETHPDESYGFPSAPHIPITTRYLDHLAASIRDALERTGMDGFMIDWVWNPDCSIGSRRQSTGGTWLACEKEMFADLMGRPFPGEAAIGKEEKLEYDRKAIDRCWGRIRDAARGANPKATIWLSCYDLKEASVAGSRMLREVDWLMNENPNIEDIQALAGAPGVAAGSEPGGTARVGPGGVASGDSGGAGGAAGGGADRPARPRFIQCVVGWGDQHDARKVLEDPRFRALGGEGAGAEKAPALGIYGFARPGDSSLPLSVAEYLSKPVEAFQGNDRNIAVLARWFNGLALDAVRGKK